MSIMAKLFGNIGLAAPAPAQNAVATPQPQTPVQPGNLPAQQNNPAAANNPTAPAAGVAATVETPAPQGLDKFNDMWNLTDAQKPKAPESPFAGVTPEAIQKVAGNTDFSKVVTPEMMTAISAGGEQAAAAMIQALNATAQQVYGQAAQASITLIEKAGQTQREQMLAELPNMIRQQTVSENLRNTNPIFNHPAAAPMLTTLQQQLQAKNPTATAEDIKAQAQEYLLSFANMANPQAQQQQQSKGPVTVDWSNW